tara:strand:+ start:769 stop:939 length:171 start_codon:yes stop_codon:yes gene_type:complete
MSLILSIFFLAILISGREIVKSDITTVVFGGAAVTFVIDMLILMFYPKIIKEACKK